MLKNYILIAWRNLLRHKIHAGINVTGLALGITCCLFIFLWVRDEKSIDHFHQQQDRLYTVYQTSRANGQVFGRFTSPIQYSTGKPDMLLEDVRLQIPEVQADAYYATGYELPWGHPETIRSGEKKFKFDGSRAGKDFFKLFSYPLLQGTRETILQDVSGIAISREMAERFFGSPEKAMGQPLRYEDSLNLKVSGVFENIDSRSSLHFDFLLPWELQKTKLEWSSNDIQHYFLLSPSADPEKVTRGLNRLFSQRQVKEAGVETSLGLQRFGDKYLYGQFVNGKPVTGRIEYVHIFTGVAIFILLIACINFMNLSTAQSVKRAKEIGLRKVVGSTRGQLLRQFISEAILFSLLAMLLSMLALLLLLPGFNQLTGKHIMLPVNSIGSWGALLALTLITGLVAGSYPAFYLSSLEPIRTLKGVIRFTRGAIFFRKGLTVLQFVLSIFLIICTIVISRQTNFLENTDLGYNKENKIYIRIEGELSKPEKYRAFKEQASRLPAVSLVDRSSEAPHAMDFVVGDAIKWQGEEKNTEVGFKPSSVGLDFIKLMNLKVVEGRGFSSDHPTDSADGFMVNEEAVREMGMKDPMGKWISAWNKRGHIIGILQDFHTQSLREPIRPVILDVKEYEYFGVIIVRTHPGKTREAIAGLESVYRRINPNFAFAYQFMDEEYQNLYKTESIVSRLSVVFSSLAILISCLGLLGLVLFAAEQRVKEIGIRKVLGASAASIIQLFSRDFLQLILLAFLIAAPVGWIIMHSWLSDFAYRIAISWWIFFVAGGAALFIALATISYQALKTARANPVKSLRGE